MAKEKQNTWTVKRILTTAAGILALLGAGGGGVYGLGLGQEQPGRSEVQQEVDRAQDAKIKSIDESLRSIDQKLTTIVGDLGKVKGKLGVE